MTSFCPKFEEPGFKSLHASCELVAMKLKLGTHFMFALCKAAYYFRKLATAATAEC